MCIEFIYWPFIILGPCVLRVVLCDFFCVSFFFHQCCLSFCRQKIAQTRTKDTKNTVDIWFVQLKWFSVGCIDIFGSWQLLVAIMWCASHSVHFSYCSLTLAKRYVTKRTVANQISWSCYFFSLLRFLFGFSSTSSVRGRIMEMNMLSRYLHQNKSEKKNDKRRHGNSTLNDKYWRERETRSFEERKKGIKSSLRRRSFDSHSLTDLSNFDVPVKKSGFLFLHFQLHSFRSSKRSGRHVTFIANGIFRELIHFIYCDLQFKYFP